MRNRTHLSEMTSEERVQRMREERAKLNFNNQRSGGGAVALIVGVVFVEILLVVAWLIFK